MATQIKTIQDKNGNIILPRTRVEAITLSDGTTKLEDQLVIFDEGMPTGELNQYAPLVHTHSVNYTVTIPSITWEGSSAPFSKSVTVTGILATDTPIIDIVQTGVYSTDQAMVTNWALIYRAVTSANTITFYATAVPSADISIQAKVVR